MGLLLPHPPSKKKEKMNHNSRNHKSQSKKKVYTKRQVNIISRYTTLEGHSQFIRKYAISL